LISGRQNPKIGQNQTFRGLQNPNGSFNGDYFEGNFLCLGDKHPYLVFVSYNSEAKSRGLQGAWGFIKRGMVVSTKNAYTKIKRIPNPPGNLSFNGVFNQGILMASMAGITGARISCYAYKSTQNAK